MFKLKHLLIILWIVSKAHPMRYKNQIVTTDNTHLNHLQNTYSTVPRIALRDPNQVSTSNDSQKIKRQKGQRVKFTIDDSSPIRESKNASGATSKVRDINTLFENYKTVIDKEKPKKNEGTRHIIEQIKTKPFKPIQEPVYTNTLSHGPIDFSEDNLTPAKSQENLIRQSVLKNMMLGHFNPINNMMMQRLSLLSNQHNQLHSSCKKQSLVDTENKVQANLEVNNFKLNTPRNKPNRLIDSPDGSKKQVLNGSVINSPLQLKSNPSLDRSEFKNVTVEQEKKVVRRRKFVVLERMNCKLCLNDVYLKQGLFLLKKH